MALDHMATYRTMSSLSRVQLLYVLQQQGELTAAELSSAVDLHHNTIREHLQRLIDDGFVLSRSEKRESRGRPRVLYTARTGAEVPDGVAEKKLETAQYRADLLKRVMVGQHAEQPLDPVADDQITKQLDILEDHLDQSGFDPLIDQPSLEIELFTCPFMGMLAEHKEMVCSVHFSLIKMMLALANGPLEADQLFPFATPNVCRLHLRVAHSAVVDDLPFPEVRA